MARPSNPTLPESRPMLRTIHSLSRSASPLASFLVAALTFLPLAMYGTWLDAEGAAKSDRDAQLEAALRKETKKIQGKYCRDLERAASFAAKNGLAAEAKALVDKIVALDPEYSRLEGIRKQVDSATAESDAAKVASARTSFARRLTAADEKHGSELSRLSTACMRVGLFTKAYDMIQNVIEISPDDAKARKILGFRKDTKTKEWMSQWEYEMRRKNFLTPEGWFEKKYEKDYEKGLRPYKGKWIPAEREQEIRTRNEYAPYTVQTEHFEVQTNLGREKAYEFAMRLEDFYGQFFRVFIGYYDQVAGAKLLFNRPDTKKQHVVLLFPDHAAYLTHVKSEHGNKELLRESAGFYWSGDRKSRFYWSDNVEETYRTLHHEVAHQLFDETKPDSRGGSQGNNWVVEGIASYIETWKKVDGTWRPGWEIDNNRLQTARSFLDGHPDWKLESFARIGYDEFHKDGRGLNYALSAALCHFFMHFDDERYKEDFVRFLKTYYEGGVREDSLATFITVEGAGGVFATLEQQLRSYLQSLRRPSDVDSSDVAADDANEDPAG